MKKNVFISFFIFLMSSLLQSSHNLINTLDARNILDTASSEERNFMLRQTQQPVIISNNSIELQRSSNQLNTNSSTARIRLLQGQAISRQQPVAPISSSPFVMQPVGQGSNRRTTQPVRQGPNRRTTQDISTLALSSLYYSE